MKFMINQASYIGDGVVEAGASIEVPPLVAAKNHPKDDNYVPPVHHIPGPHWKPLDEEAKALCEKHKVVYTGEVPDPTGDLSLQLDAALERARAAGSAIDYDKLAASTSAAVAQGVAEALKTILPLLSNSGGKK